MTKMIFLLVKLLKLTYRFRYVNEISPQKSKRPYILAIWHQNLFAGILAQCHKQHVVIISKSKDAEPVAYTCQSFGHIVTRGSSRKAGTDKGGHLAKDEMVTSLKKGIPGAVTVDGPKGPAFKVKPGIINMAISANALIIPYTVRPKWFLQFKSWDKFILPLPFTKILVHYGEAMDEFEHDKYQISCSKLEEVLNRENAALAQAVSGTK